MVIKCKYQIERLAFEYCLCILQKAGGGRKCPSLPPLLPPLLYSLICRGLYSLIITENDYCMRKVYSTPSPHPPTLELPVGKFT